MTHSLLLSVHRQDEEIQTFYSCQKFDKIGAEKFRDEILRQISNVLAGEKQSVIIPFGDGTNDDAITVIPGDVVRNNPVEIVVFEDEVDNCDDPIPLPGHYDEPAPLPDIDDEMLPF